MAAASAVKKKKKQSVDNGVNTTENPTVVQRVQKAAQDLSLAESSSTPLSVNMSMAQQFNTSLSSPDTNLMDTEGTSQQAMTKINHIQPLQHEEHLNRQPDISSSFIETLCRITDPNFVANIRALFDHLQDDTSSCSHTCFQAINENIHKEKIAAMNANAENARLKQEKENLLEAEMAKKPSLEQQEMDEARTQLKHAIESRDSDALEAAIKNFERKELAITFKEDVKLACQLLESLKKLRQLRHAILKMNAGTMAEIKNYPTPPEVVHQVMIASLLLLGEHEGKTKEWKTCQPLCNTSDLRRKVKDFRIEMLHPEIAARSKELLSDIHIDKVRATSAGAGTFYIWAMGMIEEAYTRHENISSVNPAGKSRQKEIFEKQEKLEGKSK